MSAYRWTVRVAFGGVALLTLWALFVAVARIFDLVIAGVYPEAWVLTAMMTAPFSTGEMSRRIERDDRVHIEYVPTQVVTEFIRAKVIWGESKVDGIRVFAQIMVRGLIICSSLLAKPKTPGYRMIHTAFGWACWRLVPDVV